MVDITMENLIGTRYIGPERDLICVTLKVPNEDRSENVVINTNPDNPDYKQLLDIRTIEQLEDSHNNWFDNQVSEDRKMRAWLQSYKFTPTQLDQIASGEMPQPIIEDTSAGFTWSQLINNDVTEDELFKLKLNLFEQEAVQNSKKSKQKASLRKATSVAEAFYHYASIAGVNGK